MNLAKFPRRGYVTEPTPLEALPNFSKALGADINIYIKRDDLTGIGLGGNKVRKLEFLLADAKRKGAEVVFTTGGAQFNHAMLTAACAKKLGMTPILILKKKGVTDRKGNQLLEYLMNTDVRFMDTNSYDDIYEEMDRVGKALGKPYYKIPCGGSNAIGSFYHFIDDPAVRLIGVEAAGRGIDTLETAATISTGRLGIFHGMKSYFCQDEYGQIAPVYSISAGLDYPGVGPEHAYLHDIGRAEYVAITDEDAVQAFEYLARTEGIIPAIESAHAVAYARKLAPTMGSDQLLVVTISGRGDKDCAAIARYRGEDLHE